MALDDDDLKTVRKEIVHALVDWHLIVGNTPSDEAIEYGKKLVARLNAEARPMLVVPSPAVCEECGGKDGEHDVSCHPMPALVRHGAKTSEELSDMANRAAEFEDQHGPAPAIGRTPSPAHTSPEPRWTVATDSPESSTRRVLCDGAWEASASPAIASEIVAAMNAREELIAVEDDGGSRVISTGSTLHMHANVYQRSRKRAAVEALRDAADDMPRDLPSSRAWLRERADRIEREGK